MDYLYKTTFTTMAKIVSPSDSDRFIAKASLAPLKNVLPKDVYPEDNPDLLYFSANGAVAGLCNKNGDAIDGTTALEINSSAKNKYISTDHDREKVVGVILYPGLSKFGSNDIISEEEAKTLNEPFNMCVAGILWKAINPMLSKYLINMGDSIGEDALSLSWEIAFNSYDIGVGSKNVFDAEKISQEDVRFATYNKFLRANKGEGIDGAGKDVFRIINNNPIILGYSIVPNPAGNVKGILPLGKTEDSENDASRAKIEVEKCNIPIIIKNSEEKNINLLNQCVNSNISKTMNIESIQDIETKWDEIRKLESAASVAKFLKDEIAKKSDEYVKQVQAKDDLVKTIQADKAENEKRAKELEESLAELEKEFEKVKEAAKAAELAQKFQEHMLAFEEEFEIDDEDRTIIASDVKQLDDKAFAAYMAKCKVLMKEKSKAKKAKDSKKAKDDKEDKKDQGKDEDKEKADDDESDASIKEAIASVKEEEKQTILNTPIIDKQLLESLKDSFANIKVNGKSLKEFKK